MPRHMCIKRVCCRVMQLAGQLPCADVRLPLTPMQPTTEAAIVAAFKEHAGAFGMHV